MSREPEKGKKPLGRGIRAILQDTGGGEGEVFVFDAGRIERQKGELIIALYLEEKKPLNVRKLFGDLAEQAENGVFDQIEDWTLMKEAAVTHCGVAMEYFKQAHFAEAAEHYRKALELAESAAVHFNLGLCLEELGQMREALNHYRQALRYLPHDPDLNSNLGNVLFQLGQYDKAMAAYQRVLKARPSAHFTGKAMMLPRCRRPKAIEDPDAGS